MKNIKEFANNIILNEFTQENIMNYRVNVYDWGINENINEDSIICNIDNKFVQFTKNKHNEIVKDSGWLLLSPHLFQIMNDESFGHIEHLISLTMSTSNDMKLFFQLYLYLKLNNENINYLYIYPKERIKSLLKKLSNKYPMSYKRSLQSLGYLTNKSFINCYGEFFSDMINLHSTIMEDVSINKNKKKDLLPFLI